MRRALNFNYMERHSFLIIPKNAVPSRRGFEQNIFVDFFCAALVQQRVKDIRSTLQKQV